MEGATRVKAEEGGRTKNIPETAKCDVQRGMGGGGGVLKKEAGEASRGQGRVGPHTTGF